jgi:hypothetical protein
MKRPLSSVAALALAACFAPACLAAYTATASVDVVARAEVIVGNNDPVVRAVGDSDRQTVQTGSAGASAGIGVQALLESALAGGDGKGWAQVTPGRVHLTSNAGGSALVGSNGFGHVVGRGSAFAGGSFSDGLTFSTSALAVGAPLVLSFSVDVGGSLSSGPSRFAPGVSGYSTITEMRWQVELGDMSDGRSEHLYVDNDVIIRTPSATGLWTFVATVGNGVATTLKMEASVGSSAQGVVMCFGCSPDAVQADALSSADFGHTFAWNGIQGATDAAGHTLDLSLLQVVSSSGFDYVGGPPTPVPEPSSMVLLAVGLLVLGLCRRQRRAAR